MDGLLDTTGYYALAAPACFLVCALEHGLAVRRGMRGYGCASTIGTLSTSLGEVVIGLFLGPWLLLLYQWAFERFALLRWPEGSWATWVAAFLAADLGYYWYHRAGHSVAGLWAVHGVHHQTEEFNLGIALRHPWFSDFYSAPFYAFCPLLGIPLLHFIVAITAISFYAVSIHSHLLARPGLWFLVTPQTHVVHHAWNRPYLNRNFGAMFTIWDRLFGTHVEVDPADPPRLGNAWGYETHDGARAQWVFFARLLAAARAAPSWKDALSVFLRRPGWLPAGGRWAAPSPPRPDGAIPLGLRVYAALQFAAAVVFALWLLYLREEHPHWVQVAGAAVVLGGIATLGGLLDGRRHAAWLEALRLSATLGLGIAIGLGAGGAGAWVALAGAIGLVALGLGVTREPDPSLALG